MQDSSLTISKSGNAPVWVRIVPWLCTVPILLAVFRWPLVSIYTPFLEPLLEQAGNLMLLGLLIATLIYALWQRQRPLWTRWRPFAICLITLLILIFVPFTQLYLSANFHFLRSRRTMVAQRLLAGQTGKVRQSVAIGDFIDLDASDRILSEDGLVVVDRRSGKSFVLFMTFRGILSRFSGYVYSPSDEPPPKDAFGGDGQEIDHVAPKWFFYAS